MPVVAAAVLAAGAGVRMGRPKADIVVDGVRLLDRAVATLRDGGCEPIFAVVRAGTRASGATAVVNPAPERGMRSSLQLAVDAAQTCDALAVMLVDMPAVGAEAVRAVTRHWQPGRIVVARYPDRPRAHPIVMAPALWREALAVAGPDEGARALLQRHADLVDEVPVAGSATDLDTPSDLECWAGEDR